jgi:hypothetical protein
MARGRSKLGLNMGVYNRLDAADKSAYKASSPSYRRIKQAMKERGKRIRPLPRPTSFPKAMKKPPFDATTQGMGYQEMARRTKQHNILATKQYESYKNLNLGVDAGWVNKATKGNEMNPWVMQKIGQMVGQQDRANTNMRAALKMWDTASKFETTKGYSSKKKQFIRHKEFGETARTYSKKTRKGKAKAKRQGSYVSSYLDLSVAKTGKYGVDY